MARAPRRRLDVALHRLNAGPGRRHQHRRFAPKLPDRRLSAPPAPALPAVAISTVAPLRNNCLTDQIHGCVIGVRSVTNSLAASRWLWSVTHVMTAASIGAAKGRGYARYLEGKTVTPERGDYYLTPDGEMAQAPGRWLANDETLAALG